MARATCRAREIGRRQEGTPNVVSGQTERILIVESKRGQAARLQRELRPSGYRTVPTGSPLRALDLLSQEKADLMIVVGSNLPRATGAGAAAPDALPGLGYESVGPRATDPYPLCRALKSDARGKQVPLLLVTSTWEEAALTRGLDAGADYFLFAPYQSQELLRSVRTALLNGVGGESAEAEPEIEVFLEDRMCAVTAGRSRLVRVLVSVYEDLRQTRSSLSWSRAELRNLQEQLRRERHQTERDVLLNEMVQGIAHDFGNLMETINSAAAVVGSGSPQLAPYRAALDAALAQAETLISVVQNFALFGDENPTLERVEPATIVREVLQAALLPLRAPNVRVQVRVEGLPAMRSNPILLSRCLNNLIWNAVQAMPSGGTLAISGSVQNGWVVLEVSDTGAGFPKEMPERIFETHYSTKSGHSGLGLSLVRSLVRRGGGEITVANRPGQGATLTLAFPVADRQALLSQGVGGQASSPQPAVRSRRAAPAR